MRRLGTRVLHLLLLFSLGSPLAALGRRSSLICSVCHVSCLSRTKVCLAGRARVFIRLLPNRQYNRFSILGSQAARRAVSDVLHARENRRLRSEWRRRKRRRHVLDLLNTPGGRRPTSLSRTVRPRRPGGTPFSTVRRRPRRVSRFTTSQRRPRGSAGGRDLVYACPGVLVASTATRKVAHSLLDALERPSKRTVPRLADAGFEVLPGRSSISFACSRGPASVPVRCRGARRNAAAPGDATLAVAAAREGAGPAGTLRPQVQNCLGLVGPSRYFIA